MMSKKGKKILLVIVLAIFTILLFNTNIVNAEINHSYLGADTVPDEGLDKAFDDSLMLKSLARLIYWVGRFLEWIIGTIFQMLTGVSGFPWADKIVFNTVPLLDVNFINPAEGSFTISIQELLKGLYSTILTLAFGFFGIAVLITTIKLVISSVANEKAKYKKALVDWLVGFVMLFCIHYFISFTFYLNEQLVRIASNIASTQIEKADRVAQVVTDDLATKLINKAESLGVTYNGESVAQIMKDNRTILYTWMNILDSEDTSKGAQEAFVKYVHWTQLLDVEKSDSDVIKNVGMVIKWASAPNISVEELVKVKDSVKFGVGSLHEELRDNNNNGKLDKYRGVGQAIETTEFKKLFVNNQGQFEQHMYNDFISALDNVDNVYKGIISTEEINKVELQTKNLWYDNGYVTEENTYISDNYWLLSNGIFSYGDFMERKQVTIDHDMSGMANTTFFFEDLLEDLIVLKTASDTSSGVAKENSGKKISLISDLGEYFRYNSYSKKVRDDNISGVTNGDNIQIQNMIMYSILVGQSVILFISYIKRLFYVILLAMMAPVVVVFDFFKKFGK